MKIAIIGATGFIGRKLYKSLLEDGHTVFLFVRETSDFREQETKKLHVITLNPLNLKETFEQCEAVINLAGTNINNGRWSDSFKQEMRSSRIDTTRLVVDSINSLEKKPDILINSSASGYYGSSLSDRVVTEQDNNGYDFLATLCKDWENEAIKANCKVALVRTAVVMDKKKGAFPKLAESFKMKLGVRILPGKQYLSWVHIEDLIRVYKFILKEKITGPVNAASPEAITYDTLAKVLADEYKPYFVVPVGEFIIKFLFGDIAEYITKGQNIYPKVLVDKGFEFNHKDFKEVAKILHG
jgi:uncharacterized protein (TIGR01777 family)